MAIDAVPDRDYVFVFQLPQPGGDADDGVSVRINGRMAADSGDRPQP
jgi:hypothetical protein